MSMRQMFFTIVWLITQFFSHAQQKVTFTVKQFPANTDSVFLAGSFNFWNPHDQQLLLTRKGSEFGITIELPKGMHAYKFTSGSWEQVEATAEGADISNRMLTVENDTAIVVEIDSWANRFPRKAKASSAGRNVHILDSAFYIPQLNRHRRIWLYLPESYGKSKKRYPVLYMHDGQNVFDETTSFSGEWGVDEALDSLEKQFGEVIVVAIDNGGEKRLNEYSPYDHPRFGKGEGEAYVNFIVQTLMPYINKHYRTKKGGKYNYMAGSSMGALISMYAVLRHPRKFGAAGVFSPAFWVTPQLKDYVAQRASKLRSRVYLFAGQMESDEMVPDMLSVFEILKQHARVEVNTVIRAEGSHSESTWRQEFPEFYKWIKNNK